MIPSETRRLTHRQLEVLSLRNQLLTTTEIAAHLRISYNTVKRHMVAVRYAVKPKPLTPSEQAVADLISRGLNNKEIAISRNVAIKTIEAHRLNIYRKLNVHNVAQLINRLADKAMKAHA